MGELVTLTNPTLFGRLAMYVCSPAQSFLIEITASIFARKDDLTDSGHVVDKILDKTGRYQGEGGYGQAQSHCYQPGALCSGHVQNR